MHKTRSFSNTRQRCYAQARVLNIACSSIIACATSYEINSYKTNDANNRLTQRGTGANATTYQYDDAGNLTQKTEAGKVTQYSYDTQNRLIEVNNTSNAQASLQNKLIARYGYDPLDRRIWKEQYKSADGQALAQPQRTYYLYADEGLIAESTQAITLNADGSVSAGAAPQITTQYGPRPDSEFTTGVLFVKTTNTNTSSNGQQSFAYLHHDHLQTPLQATDKAGNVVWAASYNAFGKAAITTPAATANNPTINLNLRLPGQYLDEETGLHYNWHRYYDGDIGRYVTGDPVGLAAGVNRFAYVLGNPLSRTDPLGLWSTEAHNRILNALAAQMGLSQSQLSAMMAGSKAADGGKYQDDSHSFMHAMSSARLSKSMSCKLAQDFVDKNVGEAVKGRTLFPTLENPYWQLGFGLHAVMDSTSPAHKDFAYWTKWIAPIHGPFWTSWEDDPSTAQIAETVKKMTDAINGQFKFNCGCP